ncbi:MAG: hypothetical protein WCB58_12665 [Acidobacteriaceae bacterium]
MQRLIANLLMCWMLLLVPGATALQLARPEILLPACCRTHGAHHCSMDSARQDTAPRWRGAGCPFSNLQHAAILLAPYLPASQPGVAATPQTVATSSAEQSKLSSFLAGLPGSRAPPFLS